MIYIVCLLIFALSERIFSLGVGGLSLGFGDLWVLFALPWIFLRGGKLPRIAFLLCASAFVVLFITTALSGGFGYNGLITVTLKLAIAGILFNELKHLHRFNHWFFIFWAVFVIVLLCSVFLTGFGPLANEVFNRNEMCSYMLSIATMIFLIDGNRNVRGKGYRKRFFIMLAILFCYGVIVQSRQTIVVSLVLIVATFFLLSSMRLVIPLLCVGILSVLALLPSLVSQVTDEDSLNRLETITTLEAQTRADKFRVDNALYVIQNFSDKAWFGHGITGFVKDGPYNKVVHNAYLSALYDIGLVGLSLLLVCLWIMLRPFLIAFRYRAELPDSLILPSVFACGFILQLMFIEALGKPPFYLLMGCAFYLYYQQKEFVKNTIYN